MDIEKLIDSVHPRNQKERNKLRKAISGVGFDIVDGHLIVHVNKILMGVIHDGDWYCAGTLRESVTVKTFDQGRKFKCSCVRDRYGRYWYYMFYIDTVYDDDHLVYIGVNNPDEAYDLFLDIGVGTQAYFHSCYEEWRYPFFQLNCSDYLVYGAKEQGIIPEEYLEQLIINNDLLL